MQKKKTSSANMIKPTFFSFFRGKGKDKGEKGSQHNLVLSDTIEGCGIRYIMCITHGSLQLSMNPLPLFCQQQRYKNSIAASLSRFRPRACVHLIHT